MGVEVITGSGMMAFSLVGSAEVAAWRSDDFLN